MSSMISPILSTDIPDSGLRRRKVTHVSSQTKHDSAQAGHRIFHSLSRGCHLACRTGEGPKLREAAGPCSAWTRTPRSPGNLPGPAPPRQPANQDKRATGALEAEGAERTWGSAF